METEPFVYSCDGGVDDALVIAALAHRNTPPIGIWAGEGCADQRQVMSNILRIKRQFSNLHSVPVVSPPYPKLSIPPSIERFFGENGLNNMVLCPEISDQQLQNESLNTIGLSLIQDIRAYAWLETGPCTTLANFLEMGQLHHFRAPAKVVLMGCCFSTTGLVGDVDPDTGYKCAEFNVYHDPKALSTVLHYAEEVGIPVEVVSWDECSKVRLNKNHLDSLEGQTDVDQRMLDMTRKFFDIYGSDAHSDVHAEDSLAPYYVPADMVAYHVFMDGIGRRQERRMLIQDDSKAPFFGRTTLLDVGATGDDYPDSLKFTQVIIEPEPDLVQMICESLHWRPRT